MENTVLWANQPSPTVFEPMEQRWIPSQTLVARSPLAEAETVRLLRSAVAELDPSLTVFDDGSLTSALGLALFPAKLVAVVLASFGLLAVVLAATGVYGIMAYAVSRRTREIGIRMALGAAPSEVARVVLTRTAMLLAVGAAHWFRDGVRGGKCFRPDPLRHQRARSFDLSVRDRAHGRSGLCRVLGAGATRDNLRPANGSSRGMRFHQIRRAAIGSIRAARRAGI